jgi:hypothetical protein
MKKTKSVKYPKIEIRQKNGSKGFMVGANTELFIDGKKMTTATKISFEVSAASMAKVNVEFLGEIVVTGKIGQYRQVASKIQTE